MRYTIPQKVLLEADEDRRRAERKAQLSNSTDDRMRVLLHRIRQGEINPQNLQVAAGLNDPESLRMIEALGLQPIPIPATTGNDVQYSFGLDEALKASSLSNGQILQFAADCMETAVLSYADPNGGVDPTLLRAIDAVRRNDGEEIAEIMDVIDAATEEGDPSFLDTGSIYFLGMAEYLTTREQLISGFDDMLGQILEPGTNLTYEWMRTRLLQYLKNED